MHALTSIYAINQKHTGYGDSKMKPHYREDSFDPSINGHILSCPPGDFPFHNNKWKEGT
jgi:hypothetical protein